MGVEKDFPPGEHLVTLFSSFLDQAGALESVAKKTIQKYVDTSADWSTEYRASTRTV
jgi:hypothetical protein